MISELHLCKRTLKNYLIIFKFIFYCFKVIANKESFNFFFQKCKTIRLDFELGLLLLVISYILD